MRYPSDNFYHGHSLTMDLNHSGRDEYDIMKSNLEKFGIAPSAKQIESSLDTLQLIYNSALKFGKIYQKKRLMFIRKNKLTSGSIPIDISLANDVFKFLMENIDPYYTAILLVLGLKNKLLSLIKKIKTNDPLDLQTKNLVKIIIENDNKDIIIKKILEIHIINNDNKKKKSSHKKKSKTKK